MNTLLKLKNVCYSYHLKSGETPAVADLTFDVNEGEFVSIIGPSGCGKTTVLSLISGLLTPESGEILIDGKPIKRGVNIGYMLQKDHLFPWRTIEKNVFLPLEIKKIKDEKAYEYGLELLEKYGLKNFIKSYPNQLSGGMRQRVALIRTLVFKPKILLLDEPFSALDYQTRLSVTEDVYKIIKEERQTAILVTHDISEAISVSTRVITLSPRPATVNKIHAITLPDVSPINRRETIGFSKWFEVLYKEIKANEDG